LETANAQPRSSDLVYKNDVLVLHWQDLSNCITAGSTAKVWYASGLQIRVELACGHLFNVDKKKHRFDIIPGAGTNFTWRNWRQGLVGPNHEVREKEIRLADVRNRRVEQKINTQGTAIGVTIVKPIEEKPMATKKDKVAGAMAAAGMLTPTSLTEDKPIVAPADGVMPVAGFSDQVKHYNLNRSFAKQLTETLDQSKAFFRDMAKKFSAKIGGGVTRYEFTADDGTKVKVGMPDPAKSASAVQLTSDVFTTCAAWNIDVMQLGVAETRASYTLTGEMVTWLDSLVKAQYIDQGKPIPDCIVRSESTKLTEKGIEKLMQLKSTGTEQEKAAATYLLELGMKEPTVS
jgi:hypothetical protein